MEKFFLLERFARSRNWIWLDKFTSDVIITYERSFIKMLNNKGPRIDPCVTSLDIECQFESVSLTVTLWNRFDKWSFIRVAVASSAPYSLKAISSWGKVSNAFDKSIETSPIVLWLSISFFRCSVKAKKCLYQQWYFLSKHKIWSYSAMNKFFANFW